MTKTNKPTKRIKSFKKTKKTPSSNPRRTIYKFIFIIVSIPIAIALFIALAVGSIHLSRTIKTENDKRRIATETVQTRIKHEPLSNQAHQEKINLLIAEGVIDSNLETYSEKTDTCALIPDTGGWAYTNWQQECYFTYIDYVPTTASRADLIAKLSSSPAIAERIGLPDTRSYALPCYLLIDERQAPALRYIDATLAENTCLPTAPAKGNAGEIIREHSPESEIRIVRTFKAGEMSRAQSYIEIKSVDKYFKSEKLGCKPIMCDAPLEAPVSSF
jgi:hypothetical protein